MKSSSLIAMYALPALNHYKIKRKLTTSFEGKSGGWEDSDKRRYSHHMEQVEDVLDFSLG